MPRQLSATAAVLFLISLSTFFLKGDPSAPASNKKGLCITPNALKAISSLGASWCYNWGSDRPDLPANVDYVPMVWGWNTDTGPALIDKLIEDKRDKKFTTLLGFNEPDGTFANGGCSMTVDGALNAWPQLMKVGARLGSPGTVNAEGKWMQDFMAGVEKQNLRVDFITVHWYSYPNASGLLAALDRIHKLYNRPIWITEFAPTAWDSKSAESNYIKVPMVENFMKELLPAIQATPYIERYAWFSAPAQDAHMGCSALFSEDGSLTECGKLFAADGVDPQVLPVQTPSVPSASASNSTK